jgi:hypothetical protein
MFSHCAMQTVHYKLLNILSNVFPPEISRMKVTYTNPIEVVMESKAYVLRPISLSQCDFGGVEDTPVRIIVWIQNQILIKFL